MSELSAGQFGDFFQAIHGQRPFRWQTMLMEQVVASGWPQLIDLPTASGKTACLDIAVFALALQAGREPRQRTARRRVFFVVDRRIVVDEAFTRAERLARKLADAEVGIVRKVADNLRSISDGDTPLAVGRLRGGMGKAKQAWSEDPLQAAVITGTVDQVGSRLLFRSYGGSDLVAPVHAALVAYDSLVILDEAHCSAPFMQTVASVQGYLDRDRWSFGKLDLAPPLNLVVMSATAEKKDRHGRDLSVFPTAGQRADALSDELLIKRATAEKRARFEFIEHGGISALVKRAAELANAQAQRGLERIAVMVNRVSIAHAVAEKLKSAATAAGFIYDVVLLTGQMRPLDRDDLVDKWSRFLQASNPDTPVKPIIVVTTQCLEVGADFSFDSLITQCASVDSLMQRFGRLARLGSPQTAEAFILSSRDDVRSGASDPIYGEGTSKTWEWLNEIAQNSPQPGVVNFAVRALGELVRGLDPSVLAKMVAPHPDAPILLPAHVDILCQTAPRPEPDIDVPAYLHGTGRGEPEVRTAFRVDVADAPEKMELADDSAAAYFELCPLGRQECLSVPISRLNRYLLGPKDKPGRIGDEDVEGVVTGGLESESPGTNGKPFIRFRGGKWAAIAANADGRLRPGDFVVLPVQPGEKIPEDIGTNLDGTPIDRAEDAMWRALPQDGSQVTGGAFLRISVLVLKQPEYGDVFRPVLQWLEESRKLGEDEAPDIRSLREALQFVADSQIAPDSIRKLCRSLAKSFAAKHLHRHPLDKGAWVIRLPGRLVEIDLPAREEDAESDLQHPVLLTDHLAVVHDMAVRFSRVLPPGSGTLPAVVQQAARWHDLGKFDLRFQEALGNVDTEPWAKSSKRGKVDFRHEMISLQIVEKCLFGQLPADEISRELLLHLIASHHGHARPLAPLREDVEPVDINARYLDTALFLPASERADMRPAHHIASGTADRFWLLTRYFGWWGLAYLEALVRLADWRASANPTGGEQQVMETRK